MAGFASFRALEGAIDKTVELGEATRKLGREAGLGAEDASKLVFVFEHLGLNAEDASKSLGIFAKNLTIAHEGTLGIASTGDTTSRVFKALGISAEDANGRMRSTSAVILELADKFHGMQDGAEKTGLAMQLFGRSGKDMIPVLNLGRQGLAELEAQATKLGVTLTTKNVESIHNYVLAQREMNTAFASLKLQIGEAVMPELTKLANWFVEHREEIAKFVSDAIAQFKDFASNLSKGIGAVTVALDWIPNNKGRVIEGIVLIGGALTVAFGPEAAAVVGAGILLALLGKIKSEASSMNLSKLYEQRDALEKTQEKLLMAPQLVPIPSSRLGPTPTGTPQPGQGSPSQANVYNPLKENADALAKINAQIGKAEEEAAGKIKKGGDDVKAGSDAASEGLTALATKATSLGDALMGALSTIRSAASSLFGQPTREQAQLQLRSDQLARDIANQPAFRPGQSSRGPDLTAEKAKIDKKLADLDAIHKIDKDQLTLADKTLLTEDQQRQMTDLLVVQTKDLTGKLKDTADAAGLHLIPSFDDAMNANLSLKRTLIDEVIPAHQSATKEVWNFTAAMHTAAERLSGILSSVTGGDTPGPNLPDAPFLRP